MSINFATTTTSKTIFTDRALFEGAQSNYLRAGCEVRTWKVVVRGRVYDEFEYTREPSCLCSTIKQNYLLLDTEATRQARQNLEQHLGFNPFSNRSVRAYLSAPENASQLQKVGDHAYFPIVTPSGNTSILVFVPFGKTDQAVTQVASKKSNNAPLSMDALNRLGKQCCETYNPDKSKPPQRSHKPLDEGVELTEYKQLGDQ